MAALIPAIGACTFDTTGERRLAEPINCGLKGQAPILIKILTPREEAKS